MKTWPALFIFLSCGVLLGLIPWLRTVFEFPLFYLVFLYFVFFWITQASSWNMLSGYSGYFSFGQGAFYGLGVYTAATLINKFGFALLPSLPLAGLTAALFGLGVGFVVFRLRQLRGELFGLLTLALTLVVSAVARLSKFIDGGFGISLGTVSYPVFLDNYATMMYWLGLIIALSTVFAAYVIQHARFGQGLFAIRDDEDVAQGLGVPTFRYKMIILILSCFFAGLSGGLHALQLNYITVEGVFNIRISMFVILMSLLGGRRHWQGPVLGAIIIFTLSDRFSSARLEYLNQIIIGLLLIVMMLFAREGLYVRLKRRIWPSVILFGSLLAAQALGGISTRLITQIAFAMLVTIALLLLPDSYYDKLTDMWRKLLLAVSQLRSSGSPKPSRQEQIHLQDDIEPT